MPTTRIFPNGTPNFAVGVISGVPPTVDTGADITTALGDNNLFSYVEVNLSGFIVEDFTTFTLPAGAVVSTVRNWVHAGSGSGTGVIRFQRDGSSTFDGGVALPVGTWVSNTFSASSSGAPMASQADVNGYRMRMTSLNSDPIYIHEAVVDITYALVPSATVTGPTGTSTSTTPTVTWVHTPGADAPAGQSHYRVRVLNTATGVTAYDSGVVASAATSQAVGTLPINATYQAIVNTAQVTSGVAQWSADATGTFSINVNAPTCVVNAPTGVIGTTSPTVTWTHTPGTGATTGQTFYRIRAFDVTNLTTPVSDTGAVAGAATSAVIGPLDPSKSWRVVVNTAQTTGGTVQFSADAFKNFTISVAPALISSVLVTPSDATGSISGVVTWSATSPAWETYGVQVSYDDGATWVAVRGYTNTIVPLPASGTTAPTATFIDYEAPNDTAVQYRARATRTVTGNVITGPWTLSTGDVANGLFRAKGFQVIDPDGRTFRPKGLNVGTDMVDYYPPTNAYTQGGAAMVVQPGHQADHSGDMATYGLNMIRLNIQDGLTPAVAIQRIQQVIDAYTFKKIVVLLDPHDEYGESPTIATWLASWAPTVLGPLLDANKNNPYVWVAPGNEEYHNGTEEAQWLAYHVGFYNWVRTTKTAPNTMIVADAMNFAQDMSHTSTYASLIGGRTNQVIGWHNYGGDYQSADGQFHDADEATWDAWMQAAQTAGVPVQVHEFGQVWDPNDHNDHTYPGSDADERRGVAWVLNNWGRYGIGGLAWHGTGANDNFNVRATFATAFHGAWYDTNYPLSDWGAAFFAKPTSTAVLWTNTSNETWVKDPAHPERNMKVCISSLPEATYGRNVGVFRPIGARLPVTVSDVLQAPTATVEVMTRSRGEETALLTLLSGSVLLVQAPDLPWSFGSRYLATGTITESRTSPTSKTGNRLWSIELTEVDRPA